MKTAIKWIGNTLLFIVTIASLLYNMALGGFAEDDNVSSTTSLEENSTQYMSFEENESQSMLTTYSTRSQSGPLEYTVVLDYDCDIPEERLQVSANTSISLPFTNRPRHILSTWMRESTGETYTTDQSVNIYQNEKFIAQWIAATELNAGTHYLNTDTPYTTSLSEGWQVNGGGDATSYAQGTVFYVPVAGNYTISNG